MHLCRRCHKGMQQPSIGQVSDMSLPSQGRFHIPQPPDLSAAALVHTGFVRWSEDEAIALSYPLMFPFDPPDYHP